MGKLVAGFTLIEMLVVLLVIGLMTGFIMQPVSRMRSATQMEVERGELRQSFQGLVWRTHYLHQPFSLSNKTISYELNDYHPAVNLPEGWTVNIRDEIFFGSDGQCGGGSVEVVMPDGVSEIWHLTEMSCRVEVGK